MTVDDRDPVVELVEKRAAIDWDLGGVIVHDDGSHIGHVDGLPDEFLALFTKGIGR